MYSKKRFKLLFIEKFTKELTAKAIITDQSLLWLRHNPQKSPVLNETL